MVHKKQGLFPDTFLWGGAASSAYQVEGAWNKTVKDFSMGEQCRVAISDGVISSAAAAGHSRIC